MIAQIFDHRNTYFQRQLFIGLMLIIISSIIGALIYDQLFLLGAPEVGGGFSTDLPSEPLMIGLSVIAVLHMIANRPQNLGAFIKHPISILLLLHLAWTLISVVNSDYAFIGAKFFLAKLWYVLPFYLFIGMTMRRYLQTAELRIDTDGWYYYNILSPP